MDIKTAIQLVSNLTEATTHHVLAVNYGGKGSPKTAAKKERLAVKRLLHALTGIEPSPAAIEKCLY